MVRICCHNRVTGDRLYFVGSVRSSSNEEVLYTEIPLRLPHTYICFESPDEDMPVQPPPSSERAGVTFGSLNNISKLNADVIRVWAEILNSVPGSRLLIKCPQLSDKYIAGSVEDLFRRNGINSEQLILLGRTNRREHMATYNAIDIALDPFPYGGGITTLEALWMGVQVISEAGNRWVSRVGSSILSVVGLPDMVARSRSEYVDKAVNLAGDPESLASLRRNNRILLKSSPICDISRFTKALEDRYQEKWQIWCRS